MIDVNELHRKGCLQPGALSEVQWTPYGQNVASISLRAEADRLLLFFRISSVGGAREDLAATVHIVHQPCHFGGDRPYLICPGTKNSVACGRRVAKLLSGGRYFLCRHCHSLAHASQGEDVMDRAARHANKIRRRLGGKTGMAMPFPPKPKGMWRRRYERLREQAVDAETHANEAFIVHAERLLARTRRAKGKRRLW